jgi:hypothetical protein
VLHFRSKTELLDPQFLFRRETELFQPRDRSVTVRRTVAFFDCFGVLQSLRARRTAVSTAACGHTESFILHAIHRRRAGNGGL